MIENNITDSNFQCFGLRYMHVLLSLFISIAISDDVVSTSECLHQSDNTVITVITQNNTHRYCATTLILYNYTRVIKVVMDITRVSHVHLA